MAVIGGSPFRLNGALTANAPMTNLIPPLGLLAGLIPP